MKQKNGFINKENCPRLNYINIQLKKPKNMVGLLAENWQDILSENFHMKGWNQGITNYMFTRTITMICFYPMQMVIKENGFWKYILLTGKNG